METIGFIGAFVMGITLGLIGGGGSILTVPIFVYLMHINPITATAYSLFVVGVTAAVGAFQNMKKGLVDWKTALVFSIPAFIAVYTMRKYILPVIPEKLFSIGEIPIDKNMGIMLFFAIIMFLAAISMIRSRNSDKTEETESKLSSIPLIVLEGLGVGLITGAVGAGGGFLIIPALVLLAKLPMKKAVATSLLIIAVKSLIGFIGDVENLEMDWNFLLLFTGISIIGVFIGIWLSRYIPGQKLKKGFGWFVLFMGIFIVIREYMGA